MTKVLEVPRIAAKGWGYWDTTNYPYGGCFRRLTEDTPVTFLGRLAETGKYAQESRIRFADGRIGVITNRALSDAVVSNG